MSTRRPKTQKNSSASSSKTPERQQQLLDRALYALAYLRSVCPCQNGCKRGDLTCASERARMILSDAREWGYMTFDMSEMES
jgi:hypothetical protein